MPVTGQVNALGDTEDGEVADKKKLETRNASCSRTFNEVRILDSGQSYEDQDTEKKLNAMSLQAVRKSATCISTIGTGCTDPFQTLPELAGGDTEILTYHWHSVFVNTTTPPGPRKRWFPSSVADPVLFHGIMHISAAHLAALQRSKPSPAYYQHRGEVIRLVNKRITYDQNATSDGTISAIACLLVSDSMSGHPDRARAHIMGIQQLISSRGGISNLALLTQKFVRWASLIVSITSLEPPLFCPPQMVEPDLNVYYGPPSLSTISYAQALSARLLNFTGQQEARELVTRIFWGLRNLSILKETAKMAESLNPESISFSDRVEIIEREVEELLHGNLDLPEVGCIRRKPGSNLIFTLFAYATLIYIYSGLRDLVPSFITGVLAHRLEYSLDIEDVELNILLGSFPELMLWVLFLGGSAARPKSKVWFAKTASKILRLQKLEEQVSITAASTAFLWPEGRENYDDNTGHDQEMTGLSSVEVAFASLLPSTIINPGTKP